MALAVVDPCPSDYRDARLGAAYLDPAVAAAAGVAVGETIRITTKAGRCALVRHVGEVPADAGGTIRFDRFVRQSLKAYPRDEVTVERAELPAAKEVVLVPAVGISAPHVSGLVPHVKRALAFGQVPVREAMLLYVKLPQSLAGMAYEVHAVTPAEGVVAEETDLYLEQGHDHDHGPGHGHEHEHAYRAETVLDTTYEDVGGLADQIRAVREYVELPLLFPQVYRQLGVHPPRGVVFFGASGTGKTLLARAIANEVNARFYAISAPELVGTYSGQTEENLRKIFGDASAHPPAIILIDELDAIATTRGKAGTLSDARAVTQLLALMDGLTRAEGVLIIGTTNRIAALDPALRRAGRFDREVFFPTPSAEARAQILAVLTREVPLTREALDALPDVARCSHGFVGADLMELAREAALAALRRAAREFLESRAAAAPASGELVVTRDDLEVALRKVRPSSLRQSWLSMPDVTWDDVGGLSRIKQRLRDLIEQPLRHPDRFARLGLPTNAGVLLHGPAGTGKTLLGKAIARECGVNFIGVHGPELFSEWVGESEAAVREIFDTARRAAPCVVFFDQLDAVAPPRRVTGRESTGAARRVVSQLMAELDGMEPLGQVVVLGATNQVRLVEASLLRPGRFGVHLYVPLPDDGDRADILRVCLRGAALSPRLPQDAFIARLVPLTSGFSGARIASLCQEAKRRALAETGYAGLPALEQRHFEAVLADGEVKSEVMV